jgi:hypothetical protein
LKDACVPIEKSHITLGVFYANEDSIKAIKETVEQAVLEYRYLFILREDVAKIFSFLFFDRSLHNTPIPFQLKVLFTTLIG